MKIAFPIKEDNGLDSVINEHFGNADNFLIVDMDTRDFEITVNQKLVKEAATCKTGVFKKDASIDMVITKCLGDGACRNLTKDNIKVFQAQKDTVLENLDLLKEDKLKLFHIFDFCQNKKNKKEGGCGHHH